MAAAYVALSERRPLLLLVVYGALTAAALWGALGTLSVSTDFRSLLPEDTPSVRALEEAERRRGSSDLYTIAVQSPDPRANVAFLEAVAERMAEWPEVLWVQTAEDPTFFEDRALLYLPVERLAAFRDDLDDALDCKLAEVNPLFVNLGDECANRQDSWTFDHWIGDTLARDVGLPESFFANMHPDSAGDSTTDAAADFNSAAGAPAGDGSASAADLPDDLDPYLLNEDGTIGVLYAQFDRPNMEVDFSVAVFDRGTALIAALDPTGFHPEMRAEVVGSYRSLVEASDAIGDSISALFVSMGLILLVLLGFFRAARSVVVVFLPLAMGLAWTLGIANLLYPQLNLYTLFVGSVLAGIGIDSGVHLYSRARESFRRGREWSDALVESLDRTGRAILASAVTTVGALLALLISHFRGFIEFGVVASYGIILCTLSSYLVIPPLVLLFERIRPLVRPPAIMRPARRVRSTRRKAWLAPVALTAALVVGAIILAPRAAFEYDFRNYRGRESRATGTIPYEEALGHDRTSAPAIILGDNEAQMREVHALLSQRLNDGDRFLKGFVTIETYVPPDQDARMAVIHDIERLVDRRALNRLSGEAADFVSLVRDLVEVEPFTREEVPVWARRLLQESDGSLGRLGLLFQNVQVLDILEVQQYQQRYASLSVASGDAPVASGAFITADIVDTVQTDGRRMGGLVALMLALVLLISLRNLWETLLCLASMGVAAALTIGGMVLFDIKLGMFNMIVVPAALGVSIDGAIHIVHRFQELGPQGVRRVLRTTGVAVVAASLTTAGGFGGLIFQPHQGVASIGQLAIIAILSALLAVFLLLPGLLVLFGNQTVSVEERSPADQRAMGRAVRTTRASKEMRHLRAEPHSLSRPRGRGDLDSTRRPTSRR